MYIIDVGQLYIKKTKTQKFIDIIVKKNQNRIEREEKFDRRFDKEKEANKGVWGMPRLSETTKDVVSCEKLRVGANNR